MAKDRSKSGFEPPSAERREAADSPWPDPHQRTLADRALQFEIDKAIENLADSLPLIVDLRLARVLGTVLAPSWAEHASFQDEVIFPIIARREESAADVAVLLSRLTGEHAEIAERHLEIGHDLDLLIRGKRGPQASFGERLRAALDIRRRHREAEVRLQDLLPAVLTASDQAMLEKWQAARPRPPFPINLTLDWLD